MRLRPLALLACLALTGCLLPDGYRAEIVLSKDGGYTAHFDGDLAYLTGLRDRKAGRIDDAAVEAGFAEALKEVSGVVADKPVQLGVHHVTIDKRGTLERGVTAIPGPARMLLVEAKGGELVVATPGFTDYQLRQLRGFGRDSKGSVCIRTDAVVLAHNAASAPETPGGCHMWQLDLLAGGRIEMRLKP